MIAYLSLNDAGELIAELSRMNKEPIFGDYILRRIPLRFDGNRLDAATSEEMIEKLIAAGVTTSDLRFTADADHALMIGQVIAIRCALRQLLAAN